MMPALKTSGMAFSRCATGSFFLAALALFANLVPTFQTKADLDAEGAGVPSADAGSEASLLGPQEPFDAYAAHHSRGYTRGSAEYELRRGLFAKSLAKIQAQNARPDALWVAGLNSFADRTEIELAAFRGWRGNKRMRREPSLLQTDELHSGYLDNAPEDFNWQNLSTSKVIKNQGACGSCWAVTTITVLEAHYEIFMDKNNPRSFAAQELVSCMANPQHCGGSGGCDGATVELGMEYAMKSGLGTEEDVPYRARDMACAASKEPIPTTTLQRVQVLVEGNGMIAPQTTAPPSVKVSLSSSSFGLSGYETLPVNKEAPLVKALVEKGPVAVSVSASEWHWYESGIFDSCKADCVVDHAVTLYGYSKQDKNKYWLIRNSWGDTWGEKGMIRMIRRDNEENFCGIDNDPKKGVACDGSPDKVTVCGTCGVLYDSVIPAFSKGGGQSHAAVFPASGDEERADASVILTASDSTASGRLVRRERTAAVGSVAPASS